MPKFDNSTSNSNSSNNSVSDKRKRFENPPEAPAKKKQATEKNTSQPKSIVDNINFNNVANSLNNSLPQKIPTKTQEFVPQTPARSENNQNQTTVVPAAPLKNKKNADKSVAQTPATPLSRPKITPSAEFRARAEQLAKQLPGQKSETSNSSTQNKTPTKSPINQSETPPALPPRIQNGTNDTLPPTPLVSSKINPSTSFQLIAAELSKKIMPQNLATAKTPTKAATPTTPPAAPQRQQQGTNITPQSTPLASSKSKLQPNKDGVYFAASLIKTSDSPVRSPTAKDSAKKQDKMEIDTPAKVFWPNKK